MQQGPGRLVTIAIVGDYDPNNLTHCATSEALSHAAEKLGVLLNLDWIGTDEPILLDRVRTCQAILIAPGSPYRNLSAVLEVIQDGRERNIPVLGACGGCQHIVLEYARNILGFQDAGHAEEDPNSSNLFITPLSCSLVGQRLPVRLAKGSRTRAFYGGAAEIVESYYCNFGINPDHWNRLNQGGLKIVGIDDLGEPRVLEIPESNFYVATLFVPQVASRPGNPHSLVKAFVEATVSTST
jgi:CTP synthase (UTP-ammonia lyase)